MNRAFFIYRTLSSVSIHRTMNLTLAPLAPPSRRVTGPLRLDVEPRFDRGGDEGLARVFRLFPAGIHGGADQQRLV